MAYTLYRKSIGLIVMSVIAINRDLSPTMLGKAPPATDIQTPLFSCSFFFWRFVTLDQVKMHAFILLPKHREEVCSPSNFFQVSFGNDQYDDTALI